jgi:hypothetical protein
LRIVLVIVGVAFGALILNALQSGDFGEAAAWLASDPWGVVTLADLYLGLFLVGVIIVLFEHRPLIALAWCLPLPFLGNLWTVVWLIARWPALRARFSPARSGGIGG